MTCCELVIVNVTIIIIQRIMHAFDCEFDKSNVCGLHSNANANVYGTHSNALKILWRHLNAHSNPQHSNAHSNAFVFVNKPASDYREKEESNKNM